MFTGISAGLRRKTTLAALAMGILAATAIGTSKASMAAAVMDPERNATIPTGWHFWVGQTKAQIDKRAKKAKERVVDVNVDSVAPLRFSAVLVRNAGPYARVGGWSYGSEADVTNKINATHGRLIDLEPFTVAGKRRLAYVWVKNSGDAGKGWHWNYDLSVKGVVKEINKYKIRLTDLSSYVVDGKRRYAYIGIANTGADARAWWWYVNVTPKFVQQQAVAHGARLIDVERPKAGRMTVIMQRNDESAYSRFVYDYTQTDLLRFEASNGVRITDLERYKKNGHLRYAASLIDNASPENRRVRSIWRSSTMANAPNGTDAWFGIYAKEVGGPVDVGLADSMAYQPLSVLKLIPHLFVMNLLNNDPGLDLLDQPNGISWTALKGKPDEIYCPNSMQGQRDADVLGDAAHDAHARPRRVAQPRTRGAGQQVRVHGDQRRSPCPWAVPHECVPGLQAAGRPQGLDIQPEHARRAWRALRERQQRDLLPEPLAPGQRRFYGLMANWGTNGVRNVVASEAAAAGKTRIVNGFMSYVTLNGKGGGTLIPQSDGSYQGGRGFFGRLELPFRSGRGFLIKTFVGGYFVDNFKAPCNEDTAGSSGDMSCRNWKTQQNMTYDLFMGEPYRLAIRKAIATW